MYIHADVDARFLSTADGLFDGTQKGRIAELVQNARCAGATIFRVINHDGAVVVEDNGRGIEDFSALLRLGRGKWSGAVESADDPADYGIFSLMSRTVEIASRGKSIVIKGGQWTGDPIQVRKCRDAPKRGTRITFNDSHWSAIAVHNLSRYSGMVAVVDGKRLGSSKFLVKSVVEAPELGARIGLTEDFVFGDRVPINFFGLVVAPSFDLPDSLLRAARGHVNIGVEMTGAPIGIRFVLPSRDDVVRNKAFFRLRAAVARYAAQTFCRGRHELKYFAYFTARKLGVEIPESIPKFVPYLTSEDSSRAWLDSQCSLRAQYGKCCVPDVLRDDHAANLDMFSLWSGHDIVFGEVPSEYERYAWARNLPRLVDVSYSTGQIEFEDEIRGTCVRTVDALSMTVILSDGRILTSPMSALLFPNPIDYPTRVLYVVKDNRLEVSAVQSLIGDIGDSDCETDVDDFCEEWQAYCESQRHPLEPTRRRIMDAIDNAIPFNKWRSVSVTSDGYVAIVCSDGTLKTVGPREEQT